MTKAHKLKILIISSVIFLGFFCLAKISHAANYPLEIIQPQPNLTTANRFYKAYPGLVYNVRMAVIGGAYPFTYRLTAASSGMTINSQTGEIIWPNPTAQGSPHSVTVSVTDQENTTVTRSWTITVTTSGWLFVDAVNGDNGNSGDITHPKKDFLGIYGGTTYSDKYTDTYANYFVYFRTGTYYMDGFVDAESGPYVQWVPSLKPYVWLAYPGETVTISFANYYTYFYETANNLYIDGFNVISSNTNVRGFDYESGISNVTFRRLAFSGMRHGLEGGNPSLIFQRKTEGSPGKYHVIQDCTFVDPGNAVDEHGYFVLMYTTDRTLIEDCTWSNMTHIGIGPKDSVSMVFIRNNRATLSPESAMAAILGNDTGYQTRDIEVSFNLFKSTGNSNIIALNYDSWTGWGKVYFLRNTLIGMVDVNAIDTTTGPVYFDNNVIINTYTSDPDHIYVHNSSAPERVVRTNNISGVAGDNIVDANSNLTPAYSSYLGKVGWQIGNTPPDTTPPAAPTGLAVI